MKLSHVTKMKLIFKISSKSSLKSIFLFIMLFIMVLSTTAMQASVSFDFFDQLYSTRSNQYTLDFEMLSSNDLFYKTFYPTLEYRQNITSHIKDLFKNYDIKLDYQIYLGHIGAKINLSRLVTDNLFIVGVEDHFFNSNSTDTRLQSNNSLVPFKILPTKSFNDKNGINDVILSNNNKNLPFEFVGFDRPLDYYKFFPNMTNFERRSNFPMLQSFTSMDPLITKSFQQRVFAIFPLSNLSIINARYLDIMPNIRMKVHLDLGSHYIFDILSRDNIIKHFKNIQSIKEIFLENSENSYFQSINFYVNNNLDPEKIQRSSFYQLFDISKLSASFISSLYLLIIFIVFLRLIYNVAIQEREKLKEILNVAYLNTSIRNYILIQWVFSVILFISSIRAIEHYFSFNNLIFKLEILLFLTLLTIFHFGLISNLFLNNNFEKIMKVSRIISRYLFLFTISLATSLIVLVLFLVLNLPFQLLITSFTKIFIITALFFLIYCIFFLVNFSLNRFTEMKKPRIVNLDGFSANKVHKRLNSLIYTKYRKDYILILNFFIIFLTITNNLAISNSIISQQLDLDYAEQNGDLIILNNSKFPSGKDRSIFGVQFKIFSDLEQNYIMAVNFSAMSNNDFNSMSFSHSIYLSGEYSRIVDNLIYNHSIILNRNFYEENSESDHIIITTSLNGSIDEVGQISIAKGGFFSNWFLEKYFGIKFLGIISINTFENYFQKSHFDVILDGSIIFAKTSAEKNNVISSIILGIGDATYIINNSKSNFHFSSSIFIFLLFIANFIIASFSIFSLVNRKRYPDIELLKLLGISMWKRLEMNFKYLSKLFITTIIYFLVISFIIRFLFIRIIGILFSSFSLFYYPIDFITLSGFGFDSIIIFSIIFWIINLYYEIK